jgi:hypothetical protein
VLAIGLSAQAAQAKEWVTPPGGVTPGQVHAMSMKATSNPLPWSPARAHGSATMVVSPHTGAYVPAITGGGPGTSVANQANDGVNWSAILGGAAIVGLLGALGALAFRLRPGRAATA